MNSSFTNVVLMVFTLLLALGGYGWWYHKITLESATAASLLQEIDTKTETANRASSIEAALAKLQSSQGEVQGYFISENNIVSFLEEFKTIGSAVGAKVNVVSIGAPGAKGDQVLGVSLTIDGGFDAVMRAIGAIENAPYAITVSSITMTQAATGWSAALVITAGSMSSSVSVPGSILPADKQGGASKPSGVQPL
jgi:Tfp pilus assembly protein PilO